MNNLLSQLILLLHIRYKRPFGILFLVSLMLFTAGCSSAPSNFPDEAIRTTQFEWKDTATPEVVHTPVLTPAVPTPEPTMTVEPTFGAARVWISPAVPAQLEDNIDWGLELSPVFEADDSDLQLVVLADWESERTMQSVWLYALVAPFPTLLDDVSLSDLQSAWRGDPPAILAGRQLFMEESTRLAFQSNWGPAARNSIEVTSAGQMLEMAWEQQPSLALVPFESLDPRWKVLRVNGISPIDQNMNIEAYPLALRFGLRAESNTVSQEYLANAAPFFLPENNFDPERMTVVIMTGVTALARSTALRMEEEGILYPGLDIGDVLRAADFTHISNEVPFFDGCPPAKPLRAGMRFCSDPSYLELLQSIGANIIELTGNHLMDWGSAGLRFTLDLYREMGLSYYGGGYDLEDARKPLLLEHNGNRIAFLGCNSIGPEAVFAGFDSPGASHCDREWMEDTVRGLRAQGYLPIVTFQSIELDDIKPHSMQRADFGQMSAAGAVIVSGSQAHIPQAMTFIDDRFIHYGLGNLFFDQMEPWQRPQFIDRHVFYDGRYISTELITTYLEDSARPRLMTPDEREKLLIRIFEASGW
jgi:hypothetical protein